MVPHAGVGVGVGDVVVVVVAEVGIAVVAVDTGEEIPLPGINVVVSMRFCDVAP